MPVRLAAVCALLASLQATALAQATLIVGPGGYPDVDSAVAAASPGDIIRVLPGVYPSFGVNKGVTLHGAPGVSFAGPFPPLANVPPGQTAHFVGLPLSGLGVQGGRVSIDDCQIAPNGMSVTLGAVVVMQGCTIQAISTQLSAQTLGVLNSEITLIDCTVIGGNVGTFGIPALPAIRVFNSRLRGSHLYVQGGTGSATVPGVEAIGADATSRVWVCDSTLASGDPAVCAIVAPSGHHDRCVLTPNCSTLPNGFVLGVHRPQPPQNGSTFVVDFTASPGMAVGLAGAIAFQSMAYPELEQSLLLPASSSFALATIVANAQGIATAAWPLPAGPMFVDRVVWVQGFSGFAYPLQASPLVGGVVR